jgi:hypothetical protein
LRPSKQCWLGVDYGWIVRRVVLVAFVFFYFIVVTVCYPIDSAFDILDTSSGSGVAAVSEFISVSRSFAETLRNSSQKETSELESASVWSSK